VRPEVVVEGEGETRPGDIGRAEEVLDADDLADLAERLDVAPERLRWDRRNESRRSSRFVDSVIHERERPSARRADRPSELADPPPPEQPPACGS
jgi:hypothetical protein